MSSSAPAANEVSQVEWLLLFPTRFERGHLTDLGRQRPPGSIIEICGFGLAVSGARTSQLLHRHRPNNVLLLGIAGHYDSDLSIGQAVAFSDVGCYGIGVGTGNHFTAAESLGWKQWEDDNTIIGDQINLSPSRNGRKMLLSVAAASNDAEDVERRRATFPDAVAEDMEGFSVAAACHLAGVSLHIVRGISNKAGVREKSSWRIGDAMQAAWEVGREIISESFR